MNKFIISEIEERKRFNQFLVEEKKQGIIFIRKISEPGDMAGYDVSINSGNTICLVEIKVRDFKIDKYEEGLLEKEKVERLFLYTKEMKEKYNIDEIKNLYIAFFHDGYAIWDLGLPPCNLVRIPLPRTTMGDNTKVLTDCYLYDFCDAIEVKRYNSPLDSID